MQHFPLRTLQTHLIILCPLEPMQWLTIDETVKESMARLVGALPSEVVLMNSLTANLHFMMSSFYRPTETRHKILIEMKAFPSDIHAVTSQILFHNLAPSESLLELAPRSGDEIILIEDIMSMLDREGESIALVLLGGVQYFTGQFFDLKEITKKAHQVNIRHKLIPMKLLFEFFCV